MITTAALHEFAGRCAILGIETPEPIRRGLELIEIAAGHAAPIAPVDVLKLTDTALRQRVEGISIRSHTAQTLHGAGLEVGVVRVTEEILDAVGREVVPSLDGIVAGLQPRFEELTAPQVVAARQFGFTTETTSDDVIDMGDEAASAAWRAVPRAWSALAPLVNFRISMAKVFDLAPTMEQTRLHYLPRTPGKTEPNLSVLFASDENWSLGDGYYIEGKTVGHLDWLLLARDGLRLNTPSEVDAKLASRPRSFFG